MSITTAPLINRFLGLAQRLDALSLDLLQFAARVGLAAIFWFSGRTKVDGLLSVNDTAQFLFAQEYSLPLIDPVLAAHLATYAEHLLPILLVLGLATRGAAFGLLVMTTVIQFLVYPGAWPTHLNWAALALLLVLRGGGRWSLDAWFFQVKRQPA
jgi:putative oxidoreductase